MSHLDIPAHDGESSEGPEAARPENILHDGLMHRIDTEAEFLHGRLQPETTTFRTHQGWVIEMFNHLREEQEINAIAYGLAKQARDRRYPPPRPPSRRRNGIKVDRESKKARAESDKAEQDHMFVGYEASLESTDLGCKMTTQEWDECSKSLSVDVARRSTRR